MKKKILNEEGKEIEVDDEEEKGEVKEVTMEQLKGIIFDSLKGILPELKSELKSEFEATMKDVKTVSTDEEKIEKGANFIKALVTGNESELKAVSSATGSMGYTVPTELADFILVKKDKIAKMRKYAFVFQMAGNFQLPTEGTGVTTYWVGENAEITESNPTIGKKNLADYYLAARVLIPRALINTSAYNIVNFIGELCARGLRSAEESAFVAGDGSGKPTGLRSATITQTTAQTGAALAYSDVVNGYYGLPEQYRANAVWLTSALGMKALRNIKDTQGIPIFDLRDGTIFGRPVIETSDIPANLGSATNTTEIYFGDLWYYWIKDGEAMFIETDKVIKNLQTEIVVAEAIDGVLTNADAFYKITAVK